MNIDSRMSNKRGQFTLFVIVALVVLFSFAFVMYAKNKIVTMQMVAQADRQIKEYIDKNAIDQYVTSCLDVVSQDTFMRAEGGGKLYFNESNGDKENITFIQFNDTENNRTINVSIVVDANYDCPDGRDRNQHIVFNEEPKGYGGPDYPYFGGYAKVALLESKYYALPKNYGNGPLKNNCSKYEFNQYSGFFGINNLTRLCDANGANKVGVVEGTNSLTCDYYDNSRNNSLQKAIEIDVENNIVNCVNFTDIRLRSAGNSNITNIGNATVVLTFKPGGYNVKAKYPFTVLMSNRQPITRMVDFSIDRETPFKELYEYTYELLNYNVKYAEFSILKNYTNVISRQYNRRNQNIRVYNYTVNIIEGNIGNNYTNIAKITDEEHKIKGYPLTIYVGIKERRPVLDYIHDTGTDLDYDITAVENKKIKLNPQGYDSDDDKITYSYSKWAEDYDEVYDNSTIPCQNPTDLKDIIKCMKQSTPKKIIDNWTSSEEFKTTKQNASYTPIKDDKGYHEVLIKITDEHGLSDNQIVKILVFDLPTAVITLPQIYDDVPKGYASYEDKFILSGNNSVEGFISKALLHSKLENFTWEDNIDKFKIIKTNVDDKANDPDLYLPKDTMININQYTLLDYNNLDMISIYGKGFIPPSTIPPELNPHQISLTVVETSGGADTKTREINVTQCLNHTNPDNPSYPYNKDPNNLEDSLNANHACCTNDLTYASTDTKCFENTQYGGIKSFINYQERTDYVEHNPLPINQPYYTTSTEYISNNLEDNDIFKQEFVRYCSNDRGNICSGSGSNTIKRITKGACNDYNNDIKNYYKNAGIDYERCSGPPTERIQPNSASSNEITECTNYGPGITFEGILRGETGTAYCDSKGSCNTQHQLCKGLCDGNGNCILSSGCVCDISQCGANEYCTDPNAEYNAPRCYYGGYQEYKCSQCVLITINEDKCGSSDDCDTVSIECRGQKRNAPYDNGGCTSICEYKECDLKTQRYDSVQEDCVAI